MSETKKEKCFIITPIGSETDPIRRHIEGIIDAAVKPALECKYEIVVAHKISNPGSITKQVLTEIYKDKLVIANLTQRNPNVMYELAFRHSLGLPAIMIAEEGTSLPSDIIMQRTIFYKNDALGVLELIEKLKEAEASIVYDEKDSPIYDVIKEISNEAKIIEIAKKSENAENSNVLEYILNKLSSIESHVITKPNSSVLEQPTYSSYTYIIEFAPVAKNKKDEKSKIEKQIIHNILTYPGVAGVNIDVNLNEQRIVVEIKCDRSIAFTSSTTKKIGYLIVSTALVCGLKDVVLRDIIAE